MRNASALFAVLALAAAVPAASGPPDAPASLVTLPPEALESQRRSLSALPSDVKVAYDELGGVRRLTGETHLVLGDPETDLVTLDHGAAALRALGPMLLATGSERLTVRAVRDLGPRERVIAYDQSIRGIPVLGGLSVAIDAVNGRVTALGSRFLPDRELPVAPALSAAKARRLLTEALVGSTYAVEGSVTLMGKPSLAYAKSQEDGRPALVWLVDASFTSPARGVRQERFWVHAVTGRVEGKSPLASALFDSIWNASGGSPNPFNLPQGLVPADPNAPEASGTIAHLAAVEAVFQSLGIPAGVLRVALVLNYTNQPNSWYGRMNGRDWILLGGGGALRMSQNRDAIAHEWGHMFYHYQLFGGAGSSQEALSIQEGYADLAAAIVDVGSYGLNPQTWEIAEGAVPPLNRGIRSWRDTRTTVLPTVDWYPLRWLAAADPHRNATIMGHAFYLLTLGGRHTYAGFFGIPSINVTPIGFEAARQIFLDAMLRPELYAADSFFDLKDATVAAADMRDPFVAGSAVRQAWAAVGIGHGCITTPQFPTMEIIDFLCRGRFLISWPSMPGATIYHAEKVPLGWPWTLATPFVDGPVLGCGQDIERSYRIHIRACNGCGCSNFGPAETLMYTRVCQ